MLYFDLALCVIPLCQAYIVECGWYFEYLDHATCSFFAMSVVLFLVGFGASFNH
jgi:hypothetical protein